VNRHKLYSYLIVLINIIRIPSKIVSCNYVSVLVHLMKQLITKLIRVKSLDDIG